MYRLNGWMILAALAVSAWGAGTVLADDESQPIPQARQDRLLEKFGDQGIDANSDGQLTAEEVEKFFADRPALGKGPHHMRGRGAGRRFGGGRFGGRWDGMMPPVAGGPFGEVGRLLAHLEKLNSQVVPAWFTLERFPEADQDGDGTLSAEEWSAFATQQRERLLAELIEQVPEADSDKNGVLSEQELGAVAAQLRAHVLQQHPDADTDGDGVLSEQEYAAFRASRVQELAERILERHPEADLDGDGTLSEDELAAFHDRMGGRRGPGGGHGPHGPDGAAGGGPGGMM